MSSALSAPLLPVPPLARASMLFAMAASATLAVSGLAAISSDMSPPWLLFGLSGLSLAFVGWILWRGERFGQVDAAAVVIIGCVAILVLTCLTNSQVGAVTNGHALLLLGLYAAWFTPGCIRLVLWPALALYVAIIVTRGSLEIEIIGAASAVQTLVVVEILARLRSRLEDMAHQDPLTGVLNRRAFEPAAERSLAASRRSGQRFTVVSLDLDLLKQVNDSEGHSAGDAMLVQSVQTWSGIIGPGELIGRIGGDEFALCLIDSPPDEVRALMSRLRDAEHERWSYGLAEVGPAESIRSALARADAALRADKERRRTQRRR